MWKLQKLFFVSWFFALAIANGAFADQIIITGGTLYAEPDVAPVPNAVIVINDGKISAVGSDEPANVAADAVRIDARGRYITAGYWNAHVHFIGPLAESAAQPAADFQAALNDFFLRWGFVHVVDTGSSPLSTLQLRKRIVGGQVKGPMVLMMAGGFVPEKGNPFYVEPIQLPEFTSATSAANQVNATLDLDIEGVKLFTGSWATPDKVVVMQGEHVKAAAEAAHQRGALVFAHPSDSEGARIAIENGVDVLAHTFPSEIKGPWDRSLPKKMANRGVALVPTLKLFRYDLERLSFLPPRIIDRIEAIAVAQTEAAHKEGVAILFGTDVGYMRDNNPTEEYRLLARAGMDADAILATLTTAPAVKLGFADRKGKVVPGYDADIVLLGSDPHKTVDAFGDVKMAMRTGQVVYTRDPE